MRKSFGVLLLAFVFAGYACHERDAQQEVDVADSSVKIPSYKFTRNDSAPEEGYFFIAPFETSPNASKHGTSMFILNTYGETVWCKAGVKASNFQLHENGMMSYYGDHCFYIMNGKFEVVDSVTCANRASTDAHELLWLPDDHFILIGIRYDTINGNTVQRPAGSHWKPASRLCMQYGVVQELDENKKLVWEWDSRSSFNSEDMNPAFLTDSAKLDIPHFNAIDLDSNGNLLLTARYTDEVVCVNRETGNVEWRLGGNRSDFTMINDTLPVYGQHAAYFLDNGNVLLYDNGYAMAGRMHNARAVEYKLDHTAKTATLVWSWQYPQALISESTGNAARCSDGRTLLCFGKIFNRRPNIMFALVNEKGEMEIQCSFDDTLGSYRTYYYRELPFEVNGVNAQ